jgi:hypothetical protein
MKQGATLLFEKKPKKNTKKIVYASTCPCPQGFEVVGDAKYHRLHLPAIAPRRADSNHGVVHRARGYEPRRRQGDRLLRVGAEPGNRRHRAGGFRCRLRPVQRAGVASAGGRRRIRGEGSVGVHQHAHLLHHVAQDGHVGVAFCNRWHARPLLAEAVAAVAPAGSWLRRPGDHPRERRAPQDDGRRRQRPRGGEG